AAVTLQDMLLQAFRGFVGQAAEQQVPQLFGIGTAHDGDHGQVLSAGRRATSALPLQYARSLADLSRPAHFFRRPRVRYSSSNPCNSWRRRRSTRPLARKTAFSLIPSCRATSAAGRPSTTNSQHAFQVV